jgi:hypothetical protein
MIERSFLGAEKRRDRRYGRYAKGINDALLAGYNNILHHLCVRMNEVVRNHHLVTCSRDAFVFVFVSILVCPPLVLSNPTPTTRVDVIQKKNIMFNVRLLQCMQPPSLPHPSQP